MERCADRTGPRVEPGERDTLEVTARLSDGSVSQPVSAGSLLSADLKMNQTKRENSVSQSEQTQSSECQRSKDILKVIV